MSAGTYFGKYFLLKRLAQGGMGEIYIARQQGPGGFSKTVALKKVLPHLTDNKEFIQGFLGEAALSAKMTHRNIVQVFDFGLDEETNSYYLTMEYVAGKALNQILEALQARREKMPLGLVKDISVQMCEGMSYAHNLTDDLGQTLNLVHRDLNPSNLLVSYNGDVKIIDWGIAKSEMSQVKTEAGMIKGKFVYMSPEQSMAKKLDKRSDVFAAGITLYEMLTGENPFHKPNVVLSLEAIQRLDPPPPSEFDPALAGFDPIVARALAKDKEKRYADCADMAEELKAIVVPPAPERVGQFVGRLFRADLEQEQKLMQETGASRVPPPPRSAPGVRAPAPVAHSAADDEKGGTLVMGGNEVDQERLRREMEAARRKLEAAQAAQRAAQSAPPMQEAQRTMFIGAGDLQPPPPKSSNKGLLVGVFSGVAVGLIGVAAFFVWQNQSTAKPADEQSPVVINVVQDPPKAEPAAAEPAKAEAAPEKEPEPRREERRADADDDEAKRRAAEVAAAKKAEEEEAAKKKAEEEAAAAAARKAEEEKAQAVPVVAQAAKGTLLLKPIPALPGRLDGKSLDATGRLTLRNDIGKVELGDANSPLRITVMYRIQGDKIVANVNTDPWSIVSVGETSKGRVPQTIEITNALQKLEFRRPQMDPSPRLMVKFSKD